MLSATSQNKNALLKALRRAKDANLTQCEIERVSLDALTRQARLSLEAIQFEEHAALLLEKAKQLRASLLEVVSIVLNSGRLPQVFVSKTQA